MNNRIAPVLKWAGGKTQLLDAILPLIPADIDRYYWRLYFEKIGFVLQSGFRTCSV